MHDKIKGALVALAAVALGVLVAPAPAQAVRACTADAVCFYDVNTSLAAPMIDHDAEDSSPNECHTMNSAYRNKTSYVQNRTDYHWYVWTTTNCSGTPGTLHANTNGSMTGVWNNSIKSYKRG